MHTLGYRLSGSTGAVHFFRGMPRHACNSRLENRLIRQVTENHLTLQVTENRLTRQVTENHQTRQVTENRLTMQVTKNHQTRGKELPKLKSCWKITQPVEGK